MHILLLPSWYKTPQAPLSGTFFEDQARMLQQAGHQVGVLYAAHYLDFREPDFNNKKNVAHFDDGGLPTYYSITKSVVPRCRPFNYLLAAYQALRVLKKYMARYGKPNILHAHSTFAGGIIARHLSRWTGIPYVVTEHFSGLILESMYSRLSDVDYFVRNTLMDAKQAMVVSTAFGQQLSERYGLPQSKLLVVPNTVNPLYFGDFQPKALSSPFRLVMVAFLHEMKNHLLLFQSLRLLLDRGVAVQLAVVGDGYFRKEVEQQAIETGVKSNVVFRGNLPREEVKTTIQQAHALVSTSTMETFGVSIIEALACGRPVIATNSGGPADIIRPEVGLLLEQSPSPEILAGAIMQLIENYNGYQQAQIQAYCRSRFAPQAVARQLEGVYGQAYSSVLSSSSNSTSA